MPSSSKSGNGGNGPPSNPSLNRDQNDEVDSERKKDPFLYFSNKERRMGYLMDLFSEQNALVVAGNHQDQDGTRRKTRISFELHASLIMEDALDMMRGGEDDNNESPAATIQISTILLRMLMMGPLDPADEAGGTSSYMRQNGGE